MKKMFYKIDPRTWPALSVATNRVANITANTPAKVKPSFYFFETFLNFFQ
jgi:hypothetical protein